jgi:hypothetical protein
MNHFSADQLREYKFDLLPEAQAAEVAAHLETCAECRQVLQAIETQFAALDVLNAQPEVSEERLKAVLVGGQKSGCQRSKVIPFRPIVLLAAAASLAILFMFTAEDGGSGSSSTDSDVRTARRAIPTSKTLAELRATQPFAPASNIELNVLPRRDEVQLTIYNAEDLTLVRETRKMTLKRGWNWLQFMWSNTLIDPTSLELAPKTHADQIEITQLVYPPRLNELARWTIFSEYSGEAEFELTYFTSGLKWKANYEATLAPDEQSMELKSFVRVDNGSGEDYENAQTRLVVGEINLTDQIASLAKRTHPYGSPKVEVLSRSSRVEGNDKWYFKLQEVDTEAKFVGYAAEAIKEILKQSLSEYQLYTIEGRETIPDGWGKRLPNFEAQQIGVTNLYKFEAERWGDQTMRYLSFANTEVCQLGETPLPQGQVRVFGDVDAASSRVAIERRLGEGNAAGCRVYVGAASLQYIPVGQEIELELGVARKVMVEPKLMRTRSENHAFDAKGNVSGWDEITNWKIEITNTKAIPVDVEVMRWAESPNWSIETDAAVEKYDAEHFRFTETIEAQSKRTIEYELTRNVKSDD